VAPMPDLGAEGLDGQSRSEWLREVFENSDRRGQRAARSCWAGKEPRFSSAFPGARASSRPCERPRRWRQRGGGGRLNLEQVTRRTRRIR
jgi:hypothetical protein